MAENEIWGYPTPRNCVWDLIITFLIGPNDRKVPINLFDMKIMVKVVSIYNSGAESENRSGFG